MPLVGILSDTHDRMPQIAKAVDVFRMEQPDLILHAGDFIAPFSLRPFEGLGIPMKAVYGNNDGEKKGLARTFDDLGLGELREEPFAFEVAGVRFSLMHMPEMKDEVVRRGGVDVVVFGHTHRVEIVPGDREARRPMLVNPGEVCGWMSRRKTIGFLEVPSLAYREVDLDATRLATL